MSLRSSLRLLVLVFVALVSSTASAATLARFSTHVDRSRRDRSHNLALAARAIDGTRVAAGHEFSFNRVVGDRTLKRGYDDAPVFEDERTVDGVGGGVSQVAGTLYNAALEAGLRIVEHHAHTRPVGYLPLGRDATVWWHDKDLRFVDDTGAPITIHMRLHGDELTATIDGAPRHERVHLSVDRRREGPDRVEATLHRTITRGRQVVRRDHERQVYLDPIHRRHR